MGQLITVTATIPYDSQICVSGSEPSPELQTPLLSGLLGPLQQNVPQIHLIHQAQSLHFFLCS